jgi:ribosomal protein S18 acetylase RimI-like enzyme
VPTVAPELLADHEAILELAQELSADSGCDYGQIAWWAASLPLGETEVRLWRDEGRLVGWGWLTGGTELEFDVRPSHRDVLDEILDWAHPEELLVRTDHEDAIARIEAHGLVHDPEAPWIRVNTRSLEQIDEPRLPDGYRVRTVAEHDWPSRVEAHRSAFHPSRFTGAAYAFVRSTRAYRADLDCVVEAPDGSIAAYTLAWLDELNAVGEFEPVGTHVDHRRLGLGRAVGLYALGRLRDLGAASALIACRGDAAYPIPARLYESLGFREVSRSLAYRRNKAAD